MAEAVVEENIGAIAYLPNFYRLARKLLDLPTTANDALSGIRSCCVIS